MTQPDDASAFARTTLASDTGAQLALYHRPAEAEPSCIVHINHGLAEHAARYARFAGALSAAGAHVYAHDHRGHGATTAEDAPPRVFATRRGWDAVLADAAFVNARAREAHPGLPMIIFGHSMGATVAFDHVLRAPDSVQGAAVWNVDLSPPPAATGVMKAILAAEGLTKGAHAPSAILKGMTFTAWNKRFKPNRTAFDWLSHDEEEVDAYVEDPLCGWPASISMWRDIGSGIALAGDNAALAGVDRALPFHLLGGDQDPATNGGRATRAMERRLTKAGFSDVTATVRENTRHESLNETNREATMLMFMDWMTRVAGASRRQHS